MTDSARHDVVIIGSGCNGGTAAWQLCRRGLRVLLLSGRSRISQEWSARFATWHHAEPAWRAFIARRQPTQSLHPAYGCIPRLFIDDKKHPYPTPDGRPFVWIRGRQVGGRS